MKKIFIITTLALVALVSGCNKEDKLWDAINDIKNRVEALENQVAQLNNNVEALNKLHQSGATVTKVEQDPNTKTWKITLSNGEVIDLKQGSETKATIPIMAIDDEGYWTVSYDGIKFERIKRGTSSEPVKAEAVTPKFKVDKDGYWQVSYDGGNTYTDVLGENGSKVSAFQNGTPTDSFFSSVAVENGVLKITMLNGEKLEVPVVEDFFCIIDVPVGTTQPIAFTAGEQKIYDVKVKGVDNTFISAPEGWKAKLSAADSNGNATLTITAPGGAAAPISSRATADNTKDISILATSNKYATIAKIQVRLDGAAVVPPTVTSVAVDASKTGPYELTFDVVVSNDATGFRYLAQKASLAAPTISTIISNGTAVTSISAAVKLTDLDPLTEYAIYVLAYKDTPTPTYSDAAFTAKATTKTDVIDYWEEGIVIEGVKYDKNSPGATLLTLPSDAAANLDVLTATSQTEAKVIFLELSKSASFNYAIPATIYIDYDVVIIGRRSNEKPKLIWSGANSFISLSGRNSTGTKLILKNLTLDQGARAGYMFNNQNANKTFGLFMIEDCVMPNQSKLIYYRGNQTFGINKLIFRSNSVRMTAAISPLFNFDLSTVAITYKLFDFSNNLIYGTSHFKGQLMNFAPAVQGDNAVESWNTEIKVTNNTIANYSFNNPMVRVYRFGGLNISNNIFLPGAQLDASYLYSGIQDTYVPGGSGSLVTPTYTFGNNIVYGGDTQTWDHYHSGSSAKEAPGGVNRIDKAPDSPMITADPATGSFIRTAAMKAAGIGSSLTK